MASFLATKMYPLAIYNSVADSSKPDLQVLRGPLIHLVVGSASASRSVISQLRKDLRDSCGYRQIPRFYDQLEDRLKFSCQAMFSSEEASSRRQFVLGCGAIFSCATFNSNCELVELPAWAGEESNVLDDKDGVLETMKSLFDPNEKTKSGKVLPKAYLKSAREVVKTLRESLKEDSKDIAKFRRTADAAKESIREYLNGWRGQKTVVNEESYVELEKAIRSLASFYSKAGPSATLPEEITSEILSDLNKAEELL